MTSRPERPAQIGIGTRLAYRVYLRVVSTVRSSRTVHRMLFGYAPAHPATRDAPYWDWTTLALRGALAAYLRPEASFLDLGTGIVAVLAVLARRRYGCRRVVASEYVPAVLALARAAGERAGGGIEFVCSDLFEHISGRFDVIAFNAPYLDADRAGQLGLFRDPLAERRFSGGAGGYETVSRFLRDVPARLSAGGVALLGVNHRHAAPGPLADLIRESGLQLRERRRQRGTGAAVYVLSGS